ncbi:MAG: hypothetical protein R3C03_15040 [Pirellulaceae bacterium]
MSHTNSDYQGKPNNLISSSTVRPQCNSSRVTVGPANENKKASVKLKKEGDAVQAIEVTCSCGEKILIELQY